MKGVYAHDKIKRKLVRLQHKKCAFCESKVTKIGYGDVEHFRPKAAYASVQGTPLIYPGYYWLAYAWENLYFSCQLCNQRFKMNLFPLLDEVTRATSHLQDYRLESAVLLDPGQDEPEQHITFKGEIPAPLNDSERGRRTIQLLKLDRIELNEARAEPLNTLRVMLSIVQLFPDRPEIEQEAGQALNYLRNHFHRLQQDETEYAGMFRAFYRSAEVQAML